MTDRTFDHRDFVAAYVGYVQYRDWENELGEYHRSRYAAFSKAFDIDLERPAGKRDVEAEVFHRILLDAVRHSVEASTPFSGMLELLRKVAETMREHAARLGELSAAMKKELFATACAAFEAMYGTGRTVGERELLDLGFVGGDEPDPVDSW